MARLYTEEVWATDRSEVVSAEALEGEVVTTEVGGGLHPTSAADDEFIDGILPHTRLGDNIADNPYEFREGLDAFPYDPAEEDRPNYQPLEHGATWWCKTIQDDTLPAPSIQRNAVVGVAGVEDGRVVEEGYTYDDGSGAVEYSRDGGGDFLPLGTARVGEATTVDGYDDRFRVSIDVRLQ